MPDIDLGAKRRVTMTTKTLSGVDADGKEVYEVHEAVDYVPETLLDTYVADARTRWTVVTVSDDIDHGPGGPDGATHIPSHLDHPQAGQSFAGKAG